MSLFFKIKYGEERKANGAYFVNIEYIRYIQYHEKNEAIQKSSIVPDAGAAHVEIFMSEGRRTLLFTKEEFDSKTVVKGEEI